MLRKIALLLAPDPAINPPAGGTPTPAPATPPTPEPLKLDPFVQGIADSLNMVLEPEKPKPEPAAPLPVVSLGEMAAEIDAKNKRDAEAKKTAPEPAPAVVPPVVPAPAPAPAASKPALRKITPTPAPVTPAPAAAAPAPAPDDAAKAEQAYIDALTPEQKEELAVATFAEKEGKTGLRGKLIDSYKKFDEFLKANPDADPNGEEAQKVINQNRPSWSQGEYRRAERAMIRAETIADVKKEMEPELQENQRQLREIRSKPHIEAVVAQVEEQIVKEAADLLEPEALKLLKEQGVKVASEKYPIEAPVIAGHLNAARRWREIKEETRNLNENDPMDQWLLQFVVREGQHMKMQPKEAQTLPDGRTFATLPEWSRMSKEDQAKHWTYDDPDPNATSVAELLALSAVLTIKNEHGRLEKAGYKREKAKPAEKVSPQPGNNTPPPVAPAAVTPPAPSPSSSGSPRVMGNPLPGASDGTVPSNPNAEFLEDLVPGASQVVATR